MTCWILMFIFPVPHYNLAGTAAGSLWFQLECKLSRPPQRCVFFCLFFLISVSLPLKWLIRFLSMDKEAEGTWSECATLLWVTSRDDAAMTCKQWQLLSSGRPQVSRSVGFCVIQMVHPITLHFLSFPKKLSFALWFLWLQPDCNSHSMCISLHLKWMRSTRHVFDLLLATCLCWRKA